MRSMVFIALLGISVLAACSDSLEGNGDVVTEIRAVSDFDAVRADNGVRVSLTVDPAASGDVNLAVTTDSNLQEFLTTEVRGSTLNVSSDRSGGVSVSGAFDVSATVAVIEEVLVDNGARVDIAGSVGAVTLSADNGAKLEAETVDATTVAVDVDNGAQIAVCATVAVSGEVRNGARLTVLCGGSVSDVETSDGGTVETS